LTKKVLLVDDSEAINVMNSYFFRKCSSDLEIVVARNGKEALAILERPDHLLLPDLVILDLKMPVLDGLEVLEYLDSAEFNFQDSLKIILLSTSMNPEDTRRIEKYPFVINYLVKPLSLDQVNLIVSNHLKE
jgi:CheY-like chemotaxis protein